MSSDVERFYEDWENHFERMKTQAPAVVQGFGALFGKVMSEGALSVKTKELVAISVAVARCCVSCINLHAKKCLEAGATREEILEAVGVAIVMGGGPAYTHLPAVIDALDAVEVKA